MSGHIKGPREDGFDTESERYRINLQYLAEQFMVGYLASGRTETVLRGPNGIESSNVPIEQAAFIMARRFIEQSKKEEKNDV